MPTEHDIQSLIREEMSRLNLAILFRINVASWMTKDNRFMSTGVPRGFPDLFGVRLSDGKAVFIEVKKQGGRIRSEQEKFIKKMQEYGFIAGICYSVEDAKKLLMEEN